MTGDHVTTVPEQDERQRQREKALVKARRVQQRKRAQAKTDQQLATVRRLDALDREQRVLQDTYFKSLDAVVDSDNVALLDACDRAYRALMNAIQLGKRLRRDLAVEATPMRQRADDLEDQTAQNLARRMAAAGRAQVDLDHADEL